LPISKWLTGILLFIAVACKQTKNKTVNETLPFYNTAAFDAEWIEKNDKAYHYIHTIDTFSFLNQNNTLTHSKDLKGKIYTANFFFTTCSSICPKMMNNLKKLQQQVLQDTAIQMVSFTVMPWVDTVKRLKLYADNMGIQTNKWLLLTGNQGKIYQLARQSFFAEKTLGLQKDTSQFLHTESVLLIDKHARIRGIYNSTSSTDIERIMDDIAVLKKEE